MKKKIQFFLIGVLISFIAGGLITWYMINRSRGIVLGVGQKTEFAGKELKFDENVNFINSNGYEVSLIGVSPDTLGGLRFQFLVDNKTNQDVYLYYTQAEVNQNTVYLYNSHPKAFAQEKTIVVFDLHSTDINHAGMNELKTLDMEIVLLQDKYDGYKLLNEPQAGLVSGHQLINFGK